MVQIVCANVEKHSVKMMEELHRMKQDKDHCDFIIQVGDDVYYTHRNVLSAGSAYFKAMLKHDTKESREGKVVLKEVDSHCVKNCIDFIYSGKFEIPDEEINELLHVAIMMQLEDVKHAVSDVLEESVDVENYFSTRNVADIYGLDAVSTRCRAFFLENIMEISNQPAYGNIEKTNMLNLVKSEKSKLHEEEKVTLLFNWVEKNRKNQEHLRECLEAIKFDEVSLTFLESLLESNQISNDFGLYKLINGHLLKTSKASREMNNENGKDELIILFDRKADFIRSFNPVAEKVDKFHDEKLKNLKVFSAISLDSYIYILCNNKSVHRLNFRSKNSKWEKMNDMICDHGPRPSSVFLSGSIFVVGGSNNATSDVEMFTLPVNQWSRLEDKPSAIRLTSLVSLNDSIYCIGGIGQDGFMVSSFCRLTPSLSEWVDLDPVRYPVCGSGVVAVEQKIFVIGGIVERTPFNNVECYDVTSAQWTSLPSMNACHGRVSAYHIDKWIFAVSDLETSNTFEKYDTSQDKWTEVKPKVDECLEIRTSVFVKR